MHEIISPVKKPRNQIWKLSSHKYYVRRICHKSAKTSQSQYKTKQEAKQNKKETISSGVFTPQLSLCLFESGL